MNRGQEIRYDISLVVSFIVVMVGLVVYFDINKWSADDLLYRSLLTGEIHLSLINLLLNGVIIYGIIVLVGLGLEFIYSNSKIVYKKILKLDR